MEARWTHKDLHSYNYLLMRATKGGEVRKAIGRYGQNLGKLHQGEGMLPGCAARKSKEGKAGGGGKQRAQAIMER